jgi:hypothetical protein
MTSVKSWIEPDENGHVLIPDGTIEIPEKAFYGCNTLVSIDIPNSVKCIGIEAFAYCDCLKLCKIPNSVKNWNVCILRL